VPEFDEIAGRVVQDAIADARALSAIAAIDRLMENYEVRDGAGIID